MKKIIYIVLILLSIFTFYLFKQKVYEGWTEGTKTNTYGGVTYTETTTKNKCGKYIINVKRTDNVFDASGNLVSTNDKLVNTYIPGSAMLVDASIFTANKTDHYDSILMGDQSMFISNIDGSCSNPLPPGGTTSIDNCGNKVVTDINGTIISTLDSNGYTVTTQCTK